ncbi:hypothetical protein [Azospira restricta]|uniref:Lipoprotein SmpA/OmlA domain-containing protein n=1 Tax=Azospira restricta TaxID=404405 RepID=A0A974SRK5_9RHOO|nr:hypothetical protein [Azospira restricta]QRJ65038.1 hypothetical protein IWH25_06775 [Azospira restricta]
MLSRLFVLVLSLAVAACAAYSGHGLAPGVASEAEVRATMGAPAMQWELPDGGRQLAYPRGPAGFHTFMVFIGADRRLQRTVNVLDTPYFARVQPGMSQAEVLQLLGPPQPQWSEYFAARDELVWEWRYCDSWGEAARFDVLFDGTKKTVRSTQSWTESQKSDRRIGCAR